MKQGLQLKFSQQLTMTPQLQQAIKLLQLSTLELSQEITEQLYSNPLLEEITEDQDAEHQLKKTNDEKTLTETSNLIAEELEEPSKNTEPLSQETIKMIGTLILTTTVCRLRILLESTIMMEI